MRVFFADFSDFGSILGRSGAPKISKKKQKIVFGTLVERVLDFLSFLERYWEGLGKVLGGFWEGFGGIGDDFGKVWGGFWEMLPQL